MLIEVNCHWENKFRNVFYLSALQIWLMLKYSFGV